jgi:hypothetical protein
VAKDNVGCTQQHGTGLCVSQSGDGAVSPWATQCIYELGSLHLGPGLPDSRWDAEGTSKEGRQMPSSFQQCVRAVACAERVPDGVLST